MKRKIKKLCKKYNIRNITFDSRCTKSGDAFFAVKGNYTDGNKYIDSALKKIMMKEKNI